jgi:hypothetical protein
VIEDLGSGALLDTASFGAGHERTAREAAEAKRRGRDDRARPSRADEGSGAALAQFLHDVTAQKQ